MHAAGLGNTDLVEGVSGTVTGVDTARYTLKNSVLTLPEGPGFGLDFDPNADGVELLATIE